MPCPWIAPTCARCGTWRSPRTGAGRASTRPDLQYLRSGQRGRTPCLSGRRRLVVPSPREPVRSAPGWGDSPVEQTPGSARSLKLSGENARAEAARADARQARSLAADGVRLRNLGPFALRRLVKARVTVHNPNELSGGCQTPSAARSREPVWRGHSEAAGLPVEDRGVGKPGSVKRRVMITLRAAKAYGVVLGTAILVTVPGEAGAGAFYIPQYDTNAVGRAFSGGAALATGAETVFANPAGMTRLPSSQVSIGGSVLILHLDLEDRGSTAVSNFVATTPIGGNDGGNPIDTAIVPNFYAAHGLLDNRLWLGFGVSAPFGISVEYNDQWFGRYDSIETELTTINLSPAVAYRLDDVVSIGAGLNVQYADAKLVQAIWNPIAPPNPALDGRSEIKGDTWSVGFNAGVLLNATPNTRFGLHYRSSISHNIRGTANISGVTVDPTLNRQVGVETTIDLPDIISAAVVHEPTPQLRLMGEFQWFAWSRFKELDFRFDDGVGNAARPENYRNSVTASVAAEYDITEAWTVRSGFRFDQTPTRSRFRNTSVPDADSFWLGAGISYRPTANFSVDLAYAVTFFRDVKIDLQSPGPFAPVLAETINVRASGSNRGDTVALNLRYTF
ncbi:MAG: transporter [Rhodospirillales bacterium]|nr:MAG: transporter [Rhodospirillales bacterium]